ncbi:MAG TPA: relaxase/mobilization nuclease domain-containing protein [Longimicrobium sp.]|uniref:relaxase/mobilization nuclease domain-containing protein n=1 Tax=Longimicrobium sp. TaxID=2029185 RepID=UPI002ED772B0
MIGIAKRGTGFKALAAYLVYGHTYEATPPEHRVSWIEARNLPTADPQAAARIMHVTARDSERVENPVYHLIVSFDAGDPVTRDVMRRVADRTLRDLGLQDYQALIVAHGDRAHAHLHIMVNRVHPERCTAWPGRNDYREIQKTMRAQEAELGFRIVPGTLAPVPEEALGRVERAPAPAPLLPGDAAFLERCKAQAAPHLTGACSWAELERALAAHGLRVQMKGRGMVVTDGVQEVKASDVAPGTGSRHAVERRLGSHGEYRKRLAEAERAPAPKPARTPTAPTPQPARPAGRAPAVPAAPQPPRRRRSYLEAGRDFAREVRALYADPRAARRAFLDAAARGGADRAAAALRQRPERFGALRPGADPARAAHAALAGFEYARHRSARLRPALQHAARLLRDAANADPRNRYSDLREAAAVLNSAQIGRAVTPDQLARRLAPMLPRSAAGLAQQALRIAHDLVREHEREHGRERGLSL